MRCFLAIMNILMSAACFAQPILDTEMVANDSAGHLFVVDVNEMSARLIGVTFLPLNDIAFDPNEELYGVAGRDFPDLYRIDPNSADMEWVGAVGVGGFLTGLVGDPNGVLWAAGYESIVTIDPNTGVGLLWGTTGDYQVAGDLTWDANEWLVMTTTIGELVRLDPNDRVLEVVGSLPDTDMYALARSNENILYGLNSSGHLFTVDPNTGQRTLLGQLECDFDLADPWGAAFPHEAIREPNAPNLRNPIDPNRT